MLWIAIYDQAKGCKVCDIPFYVGPVLQFFNLTKFKLKHKLHNIGITAWPAHQPFWVYSHSEKEKKNIWCILSCYCVIK